MALELKDKLYTSTQVADILGVSLRTLYRYMEDEKIKSMRTASGRHRFTKDQILEFLNAGQTSPAIVDEVDAPFRPSSKAEPEAFSGIRSAQDYSAERSGQSQSAGPVFSEGQDTTQSGSIAAPVSSRWIDDESKGDDELKDDILKPSQETAVQTEPKLVEQPFQESSPGSFAQPLTDLSDIGQEAEKSSKTAVQPETSALTDTKNDLVPENLDLGTGMSVRYYKSEYTDLIELARKIKELAGSRDMEYAFTLYAGLSLHFLIKPFTILHIYANPEDMQVWKDGLRLSPAIKKDEANVGIIINTDIVFVPAREIGGFRVVDDKVLLRDLSSSDEEELVKKFREHLVNV